MIDPGCFSGRKEPHLTSKILVLPTPDSLPHLTVTTPRTAPQRNCHPSIACTTSPRLSSSTFNSAAMSQQLSSALLRTCARQQLPSTVTRSAAIAAGQQRGVANAGAKFESPFASSEDPTSTLKIPNFKKYTSKSSPTTNKVFSYFVAGTMGLGSAVGAKATVQGASNFLSAWVFTSWL
jgi:hypothetical protein